MNFAAAFDFCQFVGELRIFLVLTMSRHEAVWKTTHAYGAYEATDSSANQIEWLDPEIGGRGSRILTVRLQPTARTQG